MKNLGQKLEARFIIFGLFSFTNDSEYSI